MTGKNDDNRWWNDPDRKCKDDLRFTNLPVGRNSRKIKGELVYRCLLCPVIKECLADAENANREIRGGLRGVIQGGKEW